MVFACGVLHGPLPGHHRSQFVDHWISEQHTLKQCHLPYYITLHFLDLVLLFVYISPYNHVLPCQNVIFPILSDISISYKLVVLGTSTQSLSSPLIISLYHRIVLGINDVFTLALSGSPTTLQQPGTRHASCQTISSNHTIERICETSMRCN